MMQNERLKLLAMDNSNTINNTTHTINIRNNPLQTNQKWQKQ